MYMAQQDHWFAKGVGFLLVPSLAAGVEVKTELSSRTNRPALAVGQAGSAALMYHLSENVLQDPEWQGFARGAMWGSIVAGSLLLFSSGRR